MKKLVAIILLLSLTLFCAVSFLGCSENDDDTSITIIMPDGGPALGMAYLMKNYSEIAGVKINYEIKGGADDIKAAVMSGEADVAIMPTNLAALLYNKGSEIKLIGTNSYGLLYLLSDQEAFTLNDLKGQVLHTVGRSGTPEAVLKKILDSASIAYDESDTVIDSNTVSLCFYDEGSEIIQKIAQGNIRYAVLGEPAVSTAIAKNASYSIVLDLQEQWKIATGTDASYPQTALVAKSSLVAKNPALVEAIASLTLVGSAALLEDAAPYIAYLKEAGATVPPSFGAQGVARARITPTFDTVAKTDVLAYLTILKDFNNKLIGGALPNDGFYYLSDTLAALNN